MKETLRKVRVTIRFTEREWVDVQEQIQMSGLSVSEYMRRRIFGLRIASKADLKVIRELQKLGGLMKHIHNEAHGVYSRETAGAIQAITSYIHTLALAANQRIQEKKQREDV